MTGISRNRTFPALPVNGDSWSTAAGSLIVCSKRAKFDRRAVEMAYALFAELNKTGYFAQNPARQVTAPRQRLHFAICLVNAGIPDPRPD